MEFADLYGFGGLCLRSLTRSYDSAIWGPT